MLTNVNVTQCSVKKLYDRALFIHLFKSGVETSTSLYFSIYGIVILPLDVRYKRPKVVVEDTWMHSV